MESIEDLCVLTVNGHVIGGQIGVYVTAQWYIKNVASDDLLRLSVFAPRKGYCVRFNCLIYFPLLIFFNNKSEALFRVATGQPVSLTLVW